MRKRSFYLALTILAAVLPAAVFAQANFDLRYDPNSVVSTTGSVLTTINYHPAVPTSGPQSVILSSSDGRIHTVFLGPGWYLRSIGFDPVAGTRLTVTGSRRLIGGHEYLVASTISTTSRVFALRGPTGLPLWSQEAVFVPPIGRGPSGGVPFAPGTVVDLSGTIASVREVQTSEDNRPLVLASISTEYGLIPVLLAPKNVLEQQGIDVSFGAPISVRGIPADVDGLTVIQVATVTQGDESLGLRTESGVVLWLASPEAPSPPLWNF